MKHSILIILPLLSLLTYGQDVKPVETEWTVDNTDNTYFKDTNNVLNKFVGTWKYEDTATNTVFEITFTKLLHDEGHKNGFVDVLTAKFKLVINNSVQYDTYTTNCDDCFIPTGFSLYTEGFENDAFVYTYPNVNMYIGNIAEPAFEDSVLSSSLKLHYQLTVGNPAQLIWTNKVDIGTDYTTNAVINDYQMPLNMVLIKQ